MAKKQLLEVGQKVWLETTHRLGTNVKYEDEPKEMIVLEANKTSAYIWADDSVKVRYKVNQRTHDVKYAMPDGCSYRIWLSKEDYELNKSEEIESKELRQILHNTIDVMSLSQLRTLHDSMFGK